eukprot:ANDGO_07496.mRNA.1 Gamma-glutamyl hydrolase A
MLRFLLCSFCLLFCCIGTLSAVNVRPIIGILTQPTGDILAPFGESYIAASYVKWIESAGARVVPVPYDATPTELDFYLASLNGIVFPGGGADLDHSTLYDTAYYIVQKVMQMNSQGDVFPLHGTCMGFELLISVMCGNPEILESFDSENITLPLSFTPAAKSSAMFGSSAPQDIVNILGSEAVTMNNHGYGISPSTFNQTKGLGDVFQVTSLNQDREGRTFVSTIEAPTYGLYGTQWHPEKPQFEWTTEEVTSHTPNAIYANQYIANFFLAQARQSNHKFANPVDETNALIYNYQPLFTGRIIIDFEQTYFFD